MFTEPAAENPDRVDDRDYHPLPAEEAEQDAYDCVQDDEYHPGDPPSDEDLAAAPQEVPPARELSSEVKVQRLSKFFRLLRGENPEGLQPLWTLPEKRTTWIPANDADRIAREVLRVASGGRDVYFALGLQPAEERPDGKRGGASTVISIPGIWVDLDVGTDGHSAKTNPPTTEAALDLVERVLPRHPPTFVVHTGGGLHVYYLFPSPFLIRNDEDRRRAEALVGRFQAAIRTEGAKHGWSVDRTADLARVLRVPYTSNLKTRTPRPVLPYKRPDGKWGFDSDRRYAIEELEALLPEVSSPAPEDVTSMVEWDGPEADFDQACSKCPWLKHTVDDAAEAKVLSFAQAHGGTVTARDVWGRNKAHFENTDTVATVMRRLEKHGAGTVREVPNSKGVSVEFALAERTKDDAPPDRPPLGPDPAPSAQPAGWGETGEARRLRSLCSYLERSGEGATERDLCKGIFAYRNDRPILAEDLRFLQALLLVAQRPSCRPGVVRYVLSANWDARVLGRQERPTPPPAPAAAPTSTPSEHLPPPDFFTMLPGAPIQPAA